MRLLPVADGLHRLDGVLRRVVVEHDAVGDAGVERLLQLNIIAHLDLDLQVLAFGFAVVASAGQRGGDASGEVHVVVLE